MREDQFINDLFEAARKEPAVRSAESVEQFMQATAGTKTSLFLQWLKQYKMNILMTASGIAITATILLFPETETTEKSVILKSQETPIEQVIIEETEKVDDTIPQETEFDNDNPESTGKEKKTLSPVVKKTPIESKEGNPLKIIQKLQTQPKQTAKIPKSLAQKPEFTEHSIILESDKGKNSADDFKAYLNENLTQLKHEFSSSATEKEIKKFTLKLDNRFEADFRMQVAGFSTLELHWEINDDGKIVDMWYRLDSKETKPLDFSRSNKSSVRVKHRHQEF